MKVSVSPAEVGAIVYALQVVYQDNTDEAALAQRLADEVYQVLGDNYYDSWLQEFDVNVF